MTPTRELVNLSVRELLAETAARTASPAAGSSAALAAALAASLVGMAARYAEASLPQAAELAARADVLRARLESLVTADGEAYAEVFAAIRLPESAPDREEVLRSALSSASDIPLEVAEAALELARLGSRLVEEGAPALRGDAHAAVALARAAGAIGATLVRVNLGAAVDGRVARALTVEGEVEAAFARATASARESGA